MTEEYQKLSTKDYTAFLLIYASYSDFKFSDDEQEIVKSYLGSSAFDHLHQRYNEMSDSDKVQTIVEGGFDHLSPDSGIKNYKDLLVNQFWVDGTYCRFEQEFMEYFENLVEALS